MSASSSADFRSIPTSAGAVALFEAGRRRPIADHNTSTDRLRELVRHQIDEGLALLNDTVVLVPAQLAELHDVITNDGNLADVVPLAPPVPIPEGYINQNQIVPVIVTTLTALESNQQLLDNRGDRLYGIQYLLSEYFGYKWVQPLNPDDEYAELQENDPMAAKYGWPHILKRPFEALVHILMRGMPRIPEGHSIGREFTVDFMLPLVQHLVHLAELTPAGSQRNECILAAAVLFRNRLFSGTGEFSVLTGLLIRCPTDLWKALWVDHFETMRLLVACTMLGELDDGDDETNKIVPYRFWNFMDGSLGVTTLQPYTQIIMRNDTRKYYRVPAHADNHAADNILVLFNLDPPRVRSMFMWKRAWTGAEIDTLIGTDERNDGVDYDSIKSFLTQDSLLASETRILEIVGSAIRKLIKDAFYHHPVVRSWSLTVAPTLYESAVNEFYFWDDPPTAMATLTALDTLTRALYSDSARSTSLLKPLSNVSLFEKQFHMPVSALEPFFIVIQHQRELGDHMRDELCAHVWKCITGFMYLVVPAMQLKANSPVHHQSPDVIISYIDETLRYNENPTIRKAFGKTRTLIVNSLEAIDDFIQKLLADTTKCPANDMSVVFLRGIQLAMTRYSLAMASAVISNMDQELRSDLVGLSFGLEPPSRPAHELPWFLVNTHRLITQSSASVPPAGSALPSASAMGAAAAAAAATRPSPLPYELQAKVASFLVATDSDDRMEGDIANMLRSLSIQDATAMVPAQLVATYVQKHQRVIILQAVHEVLACMLITNPADLYIGVQWAKWIEKKNARLHPTPDDGDVVMHHDPSTEFKVRHVVEFLLSLRFQEQDESNLVSFKSDEMRSVLNECPVLVLYQMKTKRFVPVLSFIIEYVRRLLSVPIPTPTRLLPSGRNAPNVSMFPAKIQDDVLTRQLLDRIVRLRQPEPASSSASSGSKRPLEAAAASSASSSKAQRTETGTKSNVQIELSPYERALASVYTAEPAFLHLKAGPVTPMYMYMKREFVGSTLCSPRGLAKLGGHYEAQVLQQWGPTYEWLKDQSSFQHAREQAEMERGHSLSVIESTLLAADLSEPRTKQGSYAVPMLPYPIPLEYEEQAHANKPFLQNKVLAMVRLPTNCIVLSDRGQIPRIPTWREWKEIWRVDSINNPPSTDIEQLVTVEVFLPGASIPLTEENTHLVTDAENRLFQESKNSEL